MNKTQLYTVGVALLASSAMSGIAVEVAKAPSPDRKQDSAPNPSALPERMSVDEAMAATGAHSPSEALRKAKRHNSRYGYLPHCGAKQRAKEAARQAKAAAQREAAAV